MKAFVLHAAALLAALSLVACRQSDGSMPEQNENVQNELMDVTQDLQNVAGGNPQAPEELADDLRKYAEDLAEGINEVDELSRRTVDALRGADLDEQTARQLAQYLWTAIAALELSERQVEALQRDVQTLLMTTGIAEQPAQQVAAQIGEVQQVVTNRPRRWYEWF